MKKIVRLATIKIRIYLTNCTGPNRAALDWETSSPVVNCGRLPAALDFFFINRFHLC